MDSFEMPDAGVRDLRLRLVRMNPTLLTPGAFVLIGARQLDHKRVMQFPVVLQCSLNAGRDWQDVEVVNDFEADDVINGQ